MKSYFIKTPNWVKRIFKNRIWSFTSKEKNIYLTFDDGPTPNITEWVLQELKKYNAKATFFCIGKNIENHPHIFNQIIEEGHSVGNHTHNHLNGFKCNTVSYIENVVLAEKEIERNVPNNKISKLFRPPYGKLKFSEANKLRKKGYKIIMWDVLSADFDTEISEEKCLQNVLKNTVNGSIIVFHDSIKASKKLQYVLPKVLEFYNAKGINFAKII